MSDALVLVAQHGAVRTLTLNRPQALNAFTQAMHEELRAALDAAAGEHEVRCLVLTGAGRGFCAGQDLADRAVVPGDVPVDLGASIDNNYRPLVFALRDLPLPVVCAVNGVAAGAGANVALACDLVIATRSASFIQAFCRIGLIPDAGGTFFLPRLVGSARAMGLALLGDRLTAEQAEQWGLIWRCVDDDAFTSSVDALLVQLAQAPTGGLAAIKRTLHASAGNTLDAQLTLERDTQRILGESADYREGVTAFLAKRPAHFTGR
jgi:2-(1,2-epoxy-1,2-dihydrophenyl)acetyl-CoA isomerase